MKKLLVFFFFLILTLNKTSVVNASYQYEGVAFYSHNSSAGYAAEGVAFYTFNEYQEGTVPVYRYYSNTSNDHFYVTENKQFPGYNSEGVAFYVYTNQAPETHPVYRFYNEITGNHFYTISENEKNTVINNPQWGHKYEGIAFYIYKNQVENSFPTYRLYNSETDDHLYTNSKNEKNTASVIPIYRHYNPISGDHFYVTENKQFPSYNTEGIAFYAQSTAISDSAVPIYRYYNSSSGDHFYITQKSNLTNYALEGLAYYAYTSKVSGTSPVYRFYDPSTGDHFYTISESEKNYLLQTELGPEIAVGLWKYTKSDIQATPFKIQANKNYNIRNKSGGVIAQVAGGTVTRVTYDTNGNLKISGSIADTLSNTEVSFDATDGNNADIIFDVYRPSSSYDQYRGKIKVRYTDSSNIWVINTLPLEHYVWGMGETTGTGPAEHTKVMTTIFRTYGQWYIDYATKYAVYGFKIRSDSGSQIYNGYDWETKYPNIRTNAGKTRGVVARSGSETALTPYSSWSDGRTRSFEERWGSKDYPWCKSVADPYGKNSSQTTAQLEAAGNHMVGLIANGSLKLASSDYNWDYQRIMKYYFSGISLEPNY
ncbi:MAG: hypothetical protein WC823_05590 [Parcubacteria group bacterium]|jgi:hypothetical protein